jgi:hypothetical protein
MPRRVTRTEELVAEYLAEGKQITKLPAGEAEGAGDLQSWAVRRQKGNVRVPAAPGPRKRRKRKFP